MSDKKQYWFVIRELTAREVKRKYARSHLGILWSVLNPLLTMAVISMVFSTMFRRSIENYPIYLLTGQIIWTLFSNATNSSMSALVDNRNLLLKAKLPKQTFILSRVYTALVNFGYSFLAFLMMLFLFRVPFRITYIFLIPDLILLLIMAIGIGYMLATAYVFFADIKYLYSVLLTLIMYLSAIFYPFENLNWLMQIVVGNNPVYVAINIARVSVLDGNVPEGDLWLKLLFWSIMFFGIGLLTFKRKENMVMQSI